MVPQGDDAGPGEGGDVHQVGRAELAGEDERVGEDEPPLGVGVQHLHPFPVRRSQHVAGADGPPPRHVLHRRHDADHAHRRGELPERPHGADDGGPARHVVLHEAHAFRRLDRDAPGVEGHALADEPQHRPGPVAGPLRLVAHDDDPGGLHAALPHAADETHPPRRDGLLREDLDRRPRAAGELEGAVGEDPGREQVGGLVGQLPRDVRACRQQGPPPGCRLHVRIGPAAEDELRPGQRQAVGFFGLETEIAEPTQHQPFDDGLDHRRGPAGAAASEGDAAGLAAPRGHGRGAGHLPSPVRRPVVPPPRADQEDAAGLPAGVDHVRQVQLVELAAQLAGRPGPAGGPGRRGIELAQVVVVVVLEDRGAEQIGPGTAQPAGAAVYGQDFGCRVHRRIIACFRCRTALPGGPRARGSLPGAALRARPFAPLPPPFQPARRGLSHPGPPIAASARPPTLQESAAVLLAER